MCKNNVGYCLNENRILFKQDAVSVFSIYASVFAASRNKQQYTCTHSSLTTPQHYPHTIHEKQTCKPNNGKTKLFDTKHISNK